MHSKSDWKKLFVDKSLVNWWQKFTKVFYHQSFVLYSISYITLPQIIQWHLPLSSRSSWIQAPYGVFNTNKYCIINKLPCTSKYTLHTGRNLLRGVISRIPNAMAYTTPYTSILTATLMANIHQHICGRDKILQIICHLIYLGPKDS